MNRRQNRHPLGTADHDPVDAWCKMMEGRVHKHAAVLARQELETQSLYNPEESMLLCITRDLQATTWLHFSSTFSMNAFVAPGQDLNQP